MAATARDISTAFGGSRARSRTSDHVRNDINVTPLVDVMLVLLIIFMLMTLIMGRGHDVQLPKAKNYSQEKDKMQPVVTIDADGNLSSRRTSSARSPRRRSRRWTNQVQAAWAAPKNPEGVGRIYLKADNAVEYGKVYPVLDVPEPADAVSARSTSRSRRTGGQVAMGMSAGGGKTGGVSERDQRHAADRRAARAAHHLPRRHADHDEDGDPAGPA